MRLRTRPQLLTYLLSAPWLCISVWCVVAFCVVQCLIAISLPCLVGRLIAAFGAVLVSFVLLSCCAVLRPVVALGYCSCFVLRATVLRRVFVLCRLTLRWCVLSGSLWCGPLPRCGCRIVVRFAPQPPPPLRLLCAVFCVVVVRPAPAWPVVLVSGGADALVAFSVLHRVVLGWWCLVVLFCVGVSFSVSQFVGCLVRGAVPFLI